MLYICIVFILILEEKHSNLDLLAMKWKKPLLAAAFMKIPRVCNIIIYYIIYQIVHVWNEEGEFQYVVRALFPSVHKVL